MNYPNSHSAVTAIPYTVTAFLDDSYYFVQEIS